MFKKLTDMLEFLSNIVAHGDGDDMRGDDMRPSIFDSHRITNHHHGADSHQSSTFDLHRITYEAPSLWRKWERGEIDPDHESNSGVHLGRCNPWFGLQPQPVIPGFGHPPVIPGDDFINSGWREWLVRGGTLGRWSSLNDAADDVKDDDVKDTEVVDLTGQNDDGYGEFLKGGGYVVETGPMEWDFPEPVKFSGGLDCLV